LVAIAPDVAEWLPIAAAMRNRAIPPSSLFAAPLLLAVVVAIVGDPVDVGVGVGRFRNRGATELLAIMKFGGHPARKLTPTALVRGEPKGGSAAEPATTVPATKAGGAAMLVDMLVVAAAYSARSPPYMPSMCAAAAA
jgi:hypothetical protein